MGNVEMPMGAPGATLKVPVGTYEFGANLISNKVNSPKKAVLLQPGYIVTLPYTRRADCCVLNRGT